MSIRAVIIKRWICIANLPTLSEGLDTSLTTRTAAQRTAVERGPPPGEAKASQLDAHALPFLQRFYEDFPLQTLCIYSGLTVIRAYSYYSRTGGNDDDERPINGHTAVCYIFRAYSYYNRTGGNDDDERPINGHTAAHPAAASELCINGFVGCRRKSPGVPGFGHARVP